MKTPARGVEGKLIAVEIGLESVLIQKMFGPTIFADLEITPSLERESWVIKRDGVEWVTIPAQLDSDFDEGQLDQ